MPARSRRKKIARSARRAASHSVLGHRAWALVGAGSAMVAGAVAEQVLTSGWRMLSDEDPPEDPASPNVSWKSALAWTLGTAVIFGVTQLAARRGAAAGWRMALGSDPPV
jgi:hypothetical protein